LLKEIKEIKLTKWFKEYLEIVHLEKQIANNFKQIEKNIEYYFDLYLNYSKLRKLNKKNMMK